MIIIERKTEQAIKLIDEIAESDEPYIDKVEQLAGVRDVIDNWIDELEKLKDKS